VADSAGPAYLATPYFMRTGLGNRLFQWAHCRVYCDRQDVPMVAPRWWRPALGHLVRGTVGPERFFSQIALVGLFQRGSADLPWFAGLWPRMKGQIIRESMALPVVSAAPGSLLLFDSLQCSFHSLNAYQPSLTSALLDITRPAIRRRLRALQEPMIGINVRCGKDFRSPPEEGAGSEWVGWLQQTPISWFRETLLTVRGRAGYAVPALVISDGDRCQLEELLALPAVSLLRPTNALLDLWMLARCRLLLGTGSSTFSAWAAFLGQQTAMTAPGKPMTNWGLEPQRGQLIGVFNPRKPDDSVIEAMLGSLQTAPGFLA